MIAKSHPEPEERLRRARVICLHCGKDSWVEWPMKISPKNQPCGPCGKPVKIAIDGEPKEFYTTVRDAEADGWINCYVGNHRRIYGQKRGDHRVWRPFK